MAKSPTDYKSSIVNTGDALPYPKCVIGYRLGPTGVTIDLEDDTLEQFGATLMEIKQTGVTAGGMVAFTMDGTTAVTPTAATGSTSVGLASQQIVLPNFPCMRSLDDATTIALKSSGTLFCTVTFW